MEDGATGATVISGPVFTVTERRHGSVEDIVPVAANPCKARPGDHFDSTVQ